MAIWRLLHNVSAWVAASLSVSGKHKQFDAIRICPVFHISLLSATCFPECGSGWHTDVCACVWGTPPRYVASCHGPKLHSNDSNESLPRATHQNKAIYLCVFQCVDIVHVFQSSWLPKTELGMWWKKRSWYLNMNISHSALGLGLGMGIV